MDNLHGIESRAVRFTRHWRNSLEQASTRTAFNGDALIDARRLLYFYTVARLGSFTAAEAALQVAQSALTRQVLQLESDLGVQLFIRHGRGVSMTKEGEVLYNRGADILRDMELTISDLRLSASKPGGRITFAATPNFTEKFMPTILSRLLERLSDVQVVAIEASSGAAHEMLVSGRADIAIVVNPPAKSKLNCIPLISEALSIICAPNNPLAEKKVIRPEDWSDVELLLPASRNGTRTLVDRYFMDNGVSILPAVEADSLFLSKSLLASGRLCSILAASTCAEELKAGILVEIPMRPQLVRTLCAATLHDKQGSKIFAIAMEEIKKAVEELN